MAFELEGLYIFWSITIVILLCATYVYVNDRALTQIPSRAQAVSPNRWTKEQLEQVATKVSKSPFSVKEKLPPKTGRRYIVTGGSGFLGGWIIQQLLERGESPENIRNIDIRPSNRRDFASGPASKVAFFSVDLTSVEQVKAAFSAPWPKLGNNQSEPEITVFHTAAIIRFYERHPSLVPLSAKVNIDGTQNVIDASLAVGASVLVSTSSTSVVEFASRLLLWPWEKESKHFVSVVRDDSPLPKRVEEFISVYCYTKLEGENLVNAADKKVGSSGKILRTGTLRPGSTIFGPGADSFEYFIQQGGMPSFFANMVQNFIYVENCAQAHLCYEQRLVELSQGSSNPDIGGQAFTITDPGQAPMWNDMYAAIRHFTDGGFKATSVSPTVVLFIAYSMEVYYLTRHFLCSSKLPLLPHIGKMLPALKGDLLNLQPPTLGLSLMHIIVDDSRARLPPEKGGLGFNGMYTTLEGVYRCCDEFKRNGSLRLNFLKAGFGHGK
ncbi:NAD-binding protein [Dendrothele bispora CBS 962.96]|uniref:NAD-binding protein n=1 Tax=Dendrothele bispora (strain CBS 962.96) TaxID=1314807 RepID=A0A4S8LUT1_DENBC|nr:NAD-binding protein [Dendrothele bispora CBS 962.96]